MRRLIAALLAAGLVALVLAGCGKDDPAPAAGLTRRTVTAGEIEVTMTPVRVDGSGAAFTLAFDTHSVDLDLDVAANADLAVDGRPWTNPTWDGASPGGHHREGTLRFTPAGPPSGEAVLTIRGLAHPVTATWALP